MGTDRFALAPAGWSGRGVLVDVSGTGTSQAATARQQEVERLCLETASAGGKKS